MISTKSIYSRFHALYVHKPGVFNTTIKIIFLRQFHQILFACILQSKENDEKKRNFPLKLATNKFFKTVYLNNESELCD